MKCSKKRNLKGALLKCSKPNSSVRGNALTPEPQNGTAIKGSNLAAVGGDVSNRRAAPRDGE